MEQLKVIGTEDGALVLATEAGDRYVVHADEALRSQLRKLQRDAEPRAARPSPREIQSHVRRGLSTDAVADLLGIRVEDVARYEGPVLAEREYIVSQALAVPVLMGHDFDADTQPTFGSAVRAKLAETGATAERWTSWRDDTGWNVKLEFTANEIDHDARWGFDPRSSALTPQNSDATQLSRQGSLPEGLIPRLRALDEQPEKDSSRFDSGSFGPRRVPDAEPEATRDNSAVQDAAIKRAPDAVVTNADTADLLEALRRRRGQRESMPTAERAPSDGSPVALFDALEVDEPAPNAPQEPEHAHRTEARTPEPAHRKGRTSMPSWDEIVFGARTEDG
ncbi:septation protein SepH [Microbacterium sp.]|uniref:septation protein SepH n=1 Tax=Microbacterium sp. TaxID=51671 RepID=UPI003A889AD0